MNKKLIIYFLFVFVVVTSCIAPKDLTDKIETKKINKNCPDINYKLNLPRLTIIPPKIRTVD